MPSAVRAIIPPKFNAKALMDELVRGAKDFGPQLAKAHRPTVANWTGEKPIFTPVVRQSRGAITLYIRLAGPEKGRKKWIWMNEGTPPHKIRAKNKPFLHFNVPYKAGSRPGTVQTKAASQGSEHRSKKEVMHPGTAPRKWSQLIAADMESPFRMAMSNAMARAAKASGHSTK